MFCSNCGKEMDENSKFCPNCGVENILLSSEKENKDELKEKKVKNKKGKKKVIKILSLIIGMFLIILCACKIIESINTTYYNIGDTVETDLAELTLNECELAIALSNTNDNTYFLPKEYDSSEDIDNPFVAKTGNTLIFVDFTLAAKDRDNINVNDSFRGNFYEIQYGKNKFKGNFELGLEKIEKTTFYNETANNQWEKYTTSNILISKGGKSQFRASAEIETEVKNLDDKFYITFNLPSSDGKTTAFTYVVNYK